MNIKRYASKIFFAAVIIIFILILILLLQSYTRDSDDISLEVTTTNNGVSIPVVTGLSDSDKINKKLAAIFTPYAELARQTVEDSNGTLSVKYNLSSADDSGLLAKKYDIDMNISDGSDFINILTVHVQGADKLKADEPESLDWLHSADLTECAIILKHTGMKVDLSDLDEQVGEKFAVETFIKLYEAFAGKELDVSDIKVGDSGGDTLKKALKLDLVAAYGNYDDFKYTPDVDLNSVLNIADAVINDIERDVYGRQSESVTGGEFADMLRALYNVCRVQEQEGSKYLWSALGDVNFHQIADSMELESDHEFSRRDGAEMVCRITSTGPKFSQTYDDNQLDTVEDSESIWVRRAVTYDFMDYYGDSVLFAPDEGLTVTNAIENAKFYIVCRYNDWSFATNYEWDGIYSKSDILIAAGRTAEYFANRPEEDKYNFETKTVINDRDGSWFFSQKDTGTSSSVNCMPSIAAMAAHWYDENSTVTVQDMRNTSNTDNGWTYKELRAALDVYNIPYTSDVASIDTFVSLLDDGKIILTQYSDRPSYMTGHCYVVYGYKKFNNSITFIINDSDSIAYRTEIFGRPNGNGDEVEANFAMWSIDRFWNLVTVVG